MRTKTTWRKELTDAMEAHKESWGDVISQTEFNPDRKFYAGYGSAEGEAFTLWTNKRVYFPVVYDGSEWVESVPRNPCNEITDHFGGQ